MPAMSARVRSRHRAGSRPERGAARPALFRRLVTDAERGATAATSGGAASGLESELAERLDSVLGIAEQLAATHDRQAIFRTIVDETKRALRVDYVSIRILVDDRLVIAACAGLPDERVAALPVLGIDEGWIGEVLRTGRVAAWRDVRDEPRPSRRSPCSS